MTNSYKNLFEKHSWLTPAIVALLTLGFFSRVILPPGGVLIGDDLINFFYPMFTFVMNEVRAGALPLWNPHLLSGVSVVADPEIAIFYPPNWLMLAVGVARGTTLLLVLHVWWAGWGMAKFAGSLGASALGGLLGGVIYSFSGWFIAHIGGGHYTLALAAGWVPWVLAAYLYAAQRGTWRSTLPGMAAFSLCMLTGFPPMVIQLGLLLLALASFHVLSQPDNRRVRLSAIRALKGIVLGGIVLTAVQIVPVIEFTRLSQRGASIGEEYFDFAGSFPLPGVQLVTLLFPNLLGSPARPEGYWGSPFYEELIGYASLWALVAVLLVFNRKRHSGADYLFLGIGALGAILSLGLKGGLLIILLRWVLFLQRFRVPGRYLYFVVLALSGLSALTLTHLQRMPDDERREWLRPAWRVWTPTGGLLALGGAGALRAAMASGPPHAERLGTMAESMALSGLFLLAVGATLWLWQSRRGVSWAALATFAIVIVDLWRVGMPLVSAGTGYPQTLLWDTIAATVPSDDPAIRVMPLHDAFWEQNGAAATGHYNIYGYESLEPEIYTRFVSLSLVPTARNNRLLGVEYVTTPQPIENFGVIEGEEAELLSEEVPYVYRLIDPPPRAFLVSEFEVQPDNIAAQDHLVAEYFDPERTVILDREPGCSVNGEGGQASFGEYTPNRVTVHVAAEGPSLLVLSDRWYPGWTATVDGEPVEILRAYSVLRAVCVPAGEHTVTFRFQPASLRWGAWISTAGWGALVLTAMATAMRRAILARAT
jgi:hypothetical protein